MKFLKIVVLFFLIAVPSFAQDTIRIASYNLLVFDGEPNSAARTRYFKHVLTNLDPDLLICVEMDNQYSVDLFRREALDSSVYSSAQFIDGYDHDAILYFKTAKFEVPNVRYVRTELRNIYVYTVKYKLNDSASVFYLAGAHLTAADAPDKRIARQAEANLLIAAIKKDYAYAPLMLCGDLNLYKSTEPAWAVLMKDSVFWDPCNATGIWNDGAAFVKWHSQSTRVDQFGGGANGGMDDRFDFILPSWRMARNVGWHFIKESFTPYGQDGKRLNKAVWDPTIPNTAVSDTIAHSLMLASDHLPVTALVSYIPGVDTVTSVDSQIHLPTNPTLLSAYPNPFNSTVCLNFTVQSRTAGSLRIFTLDGRQVAELANGQFERGGYTLDWSADGLPSGVYIAQLITDGQTQTIKLALTR